MDIKKISKYIEMIDEYVEEPNSIDKQWLNFMYDIRAMLRKDLCSTATADNAMDNIRAVLDYGAKMPSKAYDTDAGFDLYSREDKVVKAHNITVKLYNLGDTDYEVSKGDKISQLVILPIVNRGLIETTMINGGLRADNGFGSTGK